MVSVSVVIPTFNRSSLLRKAIDSSLAQTYPVEVVVCDHGSTDATPAVAAQYGDQIKYVRKDVDKGPIVCWRDGIENATGELVHINYDDDWIDPTFVERTLPLLKNDVAFVYTQTKVHFTDSGETEIQLRHPAGVRKVSGIVQYLLRTPLTISPGCALFRRKDLLKNLLTEVPGAKGRYGKNSGVGEDLLVFLLTTLDYPKYAHVAEPLAHFLAHPSSITINAGGTGRLDALSDAYELAKNHYLTQPGSIARAQGIAHWWARKWWKYCTPSTR